MLKSIIKSFIECDQTDDSSFSYYDAILAKDIIHLGLKENDNVSCITINLEKEILHFYITSEDAEKGIFTEVPFYITING